MAEFSVTLKTWRNTRRFSQLDLAAEANISARHLSFLETGRANPSREMVLRLCDALQIPLISCNQMLTEAGYAARYDCTDWSDEEMQPIRYAIDKVISNHMPYPAITLDLHWNIVRANPTALSLFGSLGVREGDSILEILTSGLLRDKVENWPEVVHHLVLRLRSESVSRGGIALLDEAATILSLEKKDYKPSKSPVIPTVLRIGEMRLSMFATIAQFGTPEDVTVDDLKIELFYPMDDETSQEFELIAKSNS